jgi:hypothetical protein
MARPRKYPDELRERAVRSYFEAPRAQGRHLSSNDALSTWKVVTRSVGDSSAPKSVFSSRICAASKERLWSLAGATSGNRRQMLTPRKRPKQAKTVAVGCDRWPLNLDGKEGVDGSSPSEGSTKSPLSGLLRSDRVALRRRCGGCGAVGGAVSSRRRRFCRLFWQPRSSFAPFSARHALVPAQSRRPVRRQSARLSYRPSVMSPGSGRVRINHPADPTC